MIKRHIDSNIASFFKKLYKKLTHKNNNNDSIV